jgi:hypothetical protein
VPVSVPVPAPVDPGSLPVVGMVGSGGVVVPGSGSVLGVGGSGGVDVPGSGSVLGVVGMVGSEGVDVPGPGSVLGVVGGVGVVVVVLGVGAEGVAASGRVVSGANGTPVSAQ